MSLKQLYFLINAVQDRMERMPISSPRFKAGLIVNRRLMQNLRDFQSALRTCVI